MYDIHVQAQTQANEATPSVPRKRAASAAVIAVVLLALMALMFSGVVLSRYSPDESQWIYTTRYLTLLRQGEFSSTEWDNYWTHTQPPLARYLMGSSLKLAGYDLLKVNGPWDFTKQSDENESLGNMPTPDMLLWARLPIAIVASLAVLLLYVIGNRIAGPVAGIGAAAWLAINPRSRELMTRAESDGLLICLMLAGLLISIVLVGETARSLYSGGTWRRTLLLSLLLGLVIGLATATKLTGALGLIALAFALLLDAPIQSIIRNLQFAIRERLRSLTKHLLVGGAISLVVGVVAFFVFIILNPALYIDPLSRSVGLFEFRQSEMQSQMALYPSAALAEGLPRFENAIVRTLFTYGVSAGLFRAVVGDQLGQFRDMLPVDMLLVLIGLAFAITSLFARWRQLRRDQDISNLQDNSALGAMGVALVFSAIYFVGISANMGLDWDRYTLPLWVFAALWAGVGISWLWRWATGLFRSRLVVSSQRAR